jgi:nucleotide-binding universal stress UspA family protein
MYKRILVPTDGSEFAEKAEHDALSLAQLTGAEIIALGVVETGFSLGIPSNEAVDDITEMLKKEAEENIGIIEKMKEQDHIDAKITLKIAHGSPAAVILDTIDKENIDLVVMGSSGRTGLNRVIMGSVAEKVVKSAKCSVLVVY